jgi:hypothetical protein
LLFPFIKGAKRQKKNSIAIGNFSKFAETKMIKSLLWICLTLSANFLIAESMGKFRRVLNFSDPGRVRLFKQHILEVIKFCCL